MDNPVTIRLEDSLVHRLLRTEKIRACRKCDRLQVVSQLHS